MELIGSLTGWLDSGVERHEPSISLALWTRLLASPSTGMASSSPDPTSRLFSNL